MVGITGIIITVATTNVGARYFALFLMLPGTYGCFQISNAWMANVGARPQKKRAISLAMNNAIGNISLVWTPYLYPESDGPRYTMAWGVNLGLCVVTIVAAVALRFVLTKDNAKIDSLDADETCEMGESVDAKHIEPSKVEHFHEGATTGRQLGGRWRGATARYQT